MAKRENKIEVLGDITAYGSRYGYDALGIALLDMMRNNEIHITQENACSLWEYGGNLLSLEDEDATTPKTTNTLRIYHNGTLPSPDEPDYKQKYIRGLELAKSYYGKDCNEFLDTIFTELKK
jgi:hypothetical protein